MVMNMMDLEKNCKKGSDAWRSNIQDVMEARPDDFIFYTDMFGDHTLSKLLSCFVNKEAVREEVMSNLDFYASYDMASMYCLLKNNKGFEVREEV